MEQQDYTFVIQGPVTDKTRKLVLSIREFYAESPIILSTWRGEASKLDLELCQANIQQVIESDAPSNVLSNVNRQIVSTITGLRAVGTQYAIKIRSDIILHNGNMLQNYMRYENSSARNLEARIAVHQFFTRNPRTVFPYTLHFSDLLCVGRTVDLLKIWDIPLARESEIYNQLSWTKRILQFNPSDIRKAVPEQYIWREALKKLGYSVSGKNITDKNDLLLTEQFLRESLVILGEEETGCRYEGWKLPPHEYISCVSHNDWLRMTNGLSIQNNRILKGLFYYIKVAVFLKIRGLLSILKRIILAGLNKKKRYIL